MSKNKKKDKDYPAKPVDKTSIISIDPSYSGRFRGVRRNPLDMELESEDAMLAQELKSMRVDEIVMKRRARMAKLQMEIDKLEKTKDKKALEDSEIPGISLAMARQISHLSDEEQQKIFQTYAMYRSIDQSKGRQNSLLPMLVGFAKSNPGSTQSDMATYAKAMSDQFKTGIEAMKTVMPPKEKASNATEVLKLFKDLVTDSVKRPMDELVRKVQHQPGVFEQILTNPELYNRAKEIGIFGARESKLGSTNIDLEIEKLRGEREMSGKKLELEFKKMMLEIEAKDRRTDRMLSLVGPLSAMFSGPVDERMRQLGRHTAGNPNPSQNMPTTAPSQNMPITADVIRIVCSQCGYDENKPLMGPPPDKIECPGCGAELIIGGTQTGSS